MDVAEGSKSHCGSVVCVSYCGAGSLSHGVCSDVGKAGKHFKETSVRSGHVVAHFLEASPVSAGFLPKLPYHALTCK